MVGTLLNKCTTVMKQHSITDCFQSNICMLKRHPNKAGIKTNKEIETFPLCAKKTGDHDVKPQYFNHVNTESLGVNYKNSFCA